MKSFTDGLFPQSATGVENDNNKIINEAIILDRLAGNKDALLEFYNNLGKFGARDGLLNESAATDIKLECMDQMSNSDHASILAVAKESNDEDYDTYIKSMMVAQKCIENMRNKFGNIAKDRVDTQTKELENNPRIMDALEKTQNDCGLASCV